MTTYGTELVFFCGIPYHNYYYNKTVKDPSLTLKIIRKHLCNISATATILL